MMIDENNKLALLDKAFSVEEFKKMGHDLINQLAGHLESCKGGEHKVINYTEPEEEYKFWEHYQFKDPQAFFGEVLQRNIHLHHKNFIGHQVAAPAPLTALAGLVSDMMNVGMGVYEMGAAGTAIERVVIKKFCQFIGYSDQDSDGILTSGGTLANLTALLGARASFKQFHGSAKPYILVSEQAHFCIERAAMTMGMSPEQVVKIDTNEDFTIDIELLNRKALQLKSKGKKIMCIVACACSTSTGSYDDIKAISKICSREKIWMHVDGAHGGAVIFSKKYRHLCADIHHADSVIIDAHKMMLTPALATAVLFKREADSYRSLSIEAAYLFSQEEKWFDLAKRTYETTKYMIGVKIYVIMKYYGLDLIDQYITRQYDLARQFATIISASEGFELAHEPMSNIVCFRAIDDDVDLNQLNAKIRRQLLIEGNFFIVQTTLRGQTYLRVTIMNPHTSIQDLKALLKEILVAKDKIEF